MKDKYFHLSGIGVIFSATVDNCDTKFCLAKLPERC